MTFQDFRSITRARAQNVLIHVCMVIITNKAKKIFLAVKKNIFNIHAQAETTGGKGVSALGIFHYFKHN